MTDAMIWKRFAATGLSFVLDAAWKVSVRCGVGGASRIGFQRWKGCREAKDDDHPAGSPTVNASLPCPDLTNFLRG